MRSATGAISLRFAHRECFLERVTFGVVATCDPVHLGESKQNVGVLTVTYSKWARLRATASSASLFHLRGVHAARARPHDRQRSKGRFPSHLRSRGFRLVRTNEMRRRCALAGRLCRHAREMRP